jgi:alanine racemase
MQQSMRSTYIKVDLDKLTHNFNTLKEVVGQEVKICPVVKADAYGHGAIEVSKALLKAGAQCFAVALVEEGIQLRENGIGCPILVLSPIEKAAFHQAAAYGFTVSVHRLIDLDRAKAAATLDKPLRLHLSINTGMNRDGLYAASDIKTAVDTIQGDKRLLLTGAYTHFADADGETPDYTYKQLERFKKVREVLPDGILIHAAASASALRFPEARFHMIRPGIALYGYPQVQTEADFQPILSFHSVVSAVHLVPKGQSVSYGCTYHAPKDTLVATIAAGYGDGVFRSLSGKGCALIGGVRCPIIGRVCMDQLMVDASHVPQVFVGDEAVLIGSQGAETIDAEEVGRLSGTVGYEVLTRYSRRVPRTYIGGTHE